MQIELLAPAKNKEIGIAAINCGADSIYIAGPAFGAREAAGNSVEDIAALVKYAHRFGVCVYTVVNTIIYDEELDTVEKLLWQLYEADVDAFIVQDLGILKMKLPPVRLFASTQTFINNTSQAKFLESLGFERLILERQMSLAQIKAVREAVNCDLEFFVHGAICVSYSGQCYLSRCLTGRSANRGECAQACRSRYDLVDSTGKVLLKNKSILSLKDYKLDNYIPQLIEAGISSFKIEGRLKNDSYVKNVVRHYRSVIDKYLEDHPEHSKSSYGYIKGGFTPNINATFNRGYTDCYINGTKGQWNSSDAAKSIGEYIGEISAIRGKNIIINTSTDLFNGDGLAFVGRDGQVTGYRADVVDGNSVQIKETSGLLKGQKVYRNFNIRFEKELEKNSPERFLKVAVTYRTNGGKTCFEALCEDGRKASVSFDESASIAVKPETARSSIRNQIGKFTDSFDFYVTEIESDVDYFYPASFLNSVRRSLAEKIAGESLPVRRRAVVENKPLQVSKKLTYKCNVSNHLAEELYKECGAVDIDKAYELKAPDSVEVMRTKYCIKNELGLCPKQHPAITPREPLYLTNTDYRLRLEFDCKNCEMVVIL